MNIVFLILGGSIGTVARYLLGIILMKKNPNPPFPFAMLVVNLLGSFGLGAFFGWYYGIMLTSGDDTATNLGLGIGFFGAFTTFSTFSVEAAEMLLRKNWKVLICYVLFSIVGSLMFFIIGFHFLK